jgi:predicted metal-dependent TIM-barrel fold hydrolase
MYYIQPHYHGISRTTEDYQRMAESGVVAVGEPSFWAGFDRKHSGTFIDYFRQISEFEPTRARAFGIRHFCWIAVNPKEADNLTIAREVMSQMPAFMDAPTVLGIGEIGLNKCTKNEMAVFREQMEMAIRLNQLVLIHTPHMADKLRGTHLTLDLLRELGADPARVWIDHVEEHTIRPVLDAGYWAGMTLYPQTKMSPKRAVDLLEQYGTERMLVNSSADWGPSSPFTLQQCAARYQELGHNQQELLDVFYNNPVTFLRQSRHFDLPLMMLQLEVG